MIWNQPVVGFGPEFVVFVTLFLKNKAGMSFGMSKA